MGGVSLGGDARRLMKHLRRLKDLDLTDINATLAEAMKTGTKDRFRRGESPDGKKWKPSIRAAEEGGRTLVDTARLRNSIRARADSGGFMVGTNVIYARRHQFGDARPVTIKARTRRGLRFKVGGRWITKGKVRVQLPARPFLGVSQEDLEEIKAALEEAVAEHG